MKGCYRFTQLTFIQANTSHGHGCESCINSFKIPLTLKHACFCNHIFGISIQAEREHFNAITTYRRIIEI